jgi:hypothetical protein
MKYPQLREDLIYHLRILADRDYQQSVWIEVSPRSPTQIYVEDVIHCLYDDLGLTDGDINDLIGIMLANTQEAEAVKNLLVKFDFVFDSFDVGGSEDFRNYSNTSLWNDVVEAAKIALNVFHASPTI